MVKKIVSFAAVLSLVLGLAGCAGLGGPNAGQNEGPEGSDDTQASGSKAQHATALGKANWIVEPFRYTDQDGKPFGMSNLKGKVWLADMIFTNCTSVCPVLTAHMANLQDKMKKQGIQIPIVSFSIDPKRDTPERLKKYGAKFGADFSDWHFLTGYSFKEIKQFARTSFKSPVTKYKDSDQFAHSTSFFLVNGSGKVMAKYDGLEPPYETIVKDVKALKKSGGTTIATGGHAIKEKSSAKKPLKVDISLEADTVRAGNPVKIEAVVTQGNEKVNNAKEVMFEVWQKGDQQHEMTQAKSQGNGVYIIKKTFDVPGTYYVMSHVTARGQHTMPKKKITVEK